MLYFCDDVVRIIFSYSKWNKYYDMCKYFGIGENLNGYFKSFHEWPTISQVCKHETEYFEIVKYMTESKLINEVRRAEYDRFTNEQIETIKKIGFKLLNVYIKDPDWPKYRNHLINFKLAGAYVKPMELLKLDLDQLSTIASLTKDAYYGIKSGGNFSISYPRSLWGLRHACVKGHLRTIEYLIAMGFPFSKETKQVYNLTDNDISLLDYTLKNNGSLTVVKYLHEIVKIPFSTFSMRFAFKNNDMELIKYLHRDCKLPIERGCIIQACASGNLELVQYIKLYSGVGARSYEMTQACQTNNLELVKYLHEVYRIYPYKHIYSDIINKGGNVDIFKYIYEECKIPLQRYTIESANRHNRLDILKFLITDCGLKYEQSYLCAACEFGNLDIIKYVIDTIPEIKITQKNLNIAIKHGHLEVVKYACSRLESIKLTDTVAGYVINDLQLLKFLHSVGLKFYTRSLQTAVMNNCDIKIVKYLYNKATDNGKKRKKITVKNLRLWYAARNNNIELFKYLESIGVSGNQAECEKTACSYGAWDMYNYLKEKGVKGELMID